MIAYNTITPAFNHYVEAYSSTIREKSVLPLEKIQLKQRQWIIEMEDSASDPKQNTPSIIGHDIKLTYRAKSNILAGLIKINVNQMTSQIRHGLIRMCIVQK